MFEMKCETPAHEIFGTKIKQKDDIILQISKKYLSLHPLNSNKD